MSVRTSLVGSMIDDGPLEVFSRGAGPAVVLVGGGGTNASVYGRIADRLADQHLTVHVYNRRGRGRSAARPPDYGLACEVGDLAAVLARTRSARVIGHSVGGFFALAAARELPIERLALFDPAVSVDGRFPSGFLPDLERAVADGDAVTALVVAGKGLQNPGASWLPEPIQRAAVRAVMLTAPGRTLAELIGTVPAEAGLALGADGPAGQWSGVTARTRFYIGTRSPAYYEPTARLLAAAMPDASVEMVPRLGHDALARAPRRLVASLARFLVG